MGYKVVSGLGTSFPIKFEGGNPARAKYLNSRQQSQNNLPNTPYDPSPSSWTTTGRPTQTDATYAVRTESPS